MNLALCIKKTGVKLSKFQKDSILSEYNKMRGIGMEERKAALKAINDRMDELTKERMKILSLIDEKTGPLEEPLPPVDTEVKFSKKALDSVHTKVKAQEPKVRFSRPANINLTPEQAFQYDQELLAEGNLGNKSFLDRLWEFTDDSIHEGNVEIKKLEEKLYDKIGAKRKGPILGPLLGRRTVDTDLTQKALHLYLDTRGTGEQLSNYYASVTEKLRTATGKEKVRLQHHKQIIERLGTLDQDLKEWADRELRGYYDSVFSKAEEAGVIGSFVEDYARRIWKAPEGMEDIWSYWGATNQRSLGSIIEGWEKGFDLRVEGALPALQAYMTEMNTKIAYKTFKKYGMDLTDLNGNSMFVPKGSKITIDGVEKELEDTGYREVENKAFSVWVPKGWIYAKGKGATLQMTQTSFKDVFLARPGESEKTARAYERVQLYAPKGIADAINKQFPKGQDIFDSTPALKWLLGYNARVKGSILSLSFFHYLAGARSWMFGVRGGSLNPIKAQKQGMAKIMALDPIIKLGVRNGLTIGAVQDFDTQAFEDRKNLLQRVSASLGMENVEKFATWGRNVRERFTNSMFKVWFAGLKAEAFSVEYAHELKKQQERLAKGEIDEVNIDKVAETVAGLINDDFGGLHNRRLGKNPSAAKFWRMLMLAPDWTFSNFRTVTGALGMNKAIQKATGQTVTATPESRRIHQRFWGGAIVKFLASQVIANAMIYAIFGDDDDDLLAFYGDQFKNNFTKLKWAYVDVTPILKTFGGKPENHKGVSLIGHFIDPVKVFKLDELIKGKESPVVRIAEHLITGTDYAKRPFTPVGTLLKEGRTIAKSRHEKVANVWQRLPSTVIKTLEGMTPIAVQQVFATIRGEEHGMEALARSIGIHTSTMYGTSEEQEFANVKSDINAIEKEYNEAKKIKDEQGVLDAVEKIKDYKGYRSIKKVLDITNKKLKPINGKIKLYELMMKKRDLTPAQQEYYNDLLERKKAVIKEFNKVYKNYK